MTAASERSVHMIWLVLVIATVGSFGTAEFLGHPGLGVAGIIGIAAFKIRLIIRHFMELKRGPLGLRVFFDVWIAACAAMIIGLYWLATDQ